MTRNEINRVFSKSISIGYCAAQALLRYQDRIGYNSGVYGWNYDVYAVDGVAICTGYRSMPGGRVDYELLKKYEKKAEKISYDRVLTYDQKRKKVNALLHKFIEEVA